MITYTIAQFAIHIKQKREIQFLKTKKIIRIAGKIMKLEQPRTIYLENTPVWSNLDFISDSSLTEIIIYVKLLCVIVILYKIKYFIFHIPPPPTVL